MEFIVLDPSIATEEQLIATIACNNRTARLMRGEVEKLRRVSEDAKKTKKPAIQETPVEVERKTTESRDEDFENEVEYYYSQMKELRLDNIDDEFEMAIPSRKHYQYERILIRLKLESLRAIKEVKDLFAEEGLSIEDMISFKEEIELELKKIELINRALEPVKEEQLVEAKENNLIFVPTLGGDIRVLEELDSIAPEYYERFVGLLQSIKDGTFKSVKRFTSGSELSGLCEVKDFKVRVVFMRLNKDSYAIISAFVKKSDNDKAYRASLFKKYSDFKLVEDELIDSLSDESFIRLHKTHEEEVFRKLNQSADKTLPLIKRKTGEE